MMKLNKKSCYYNKIVSNNQKGITLITLVVTIVILIILAGVVINMTVGENGLFEKAKEAKEQYEIAGIREEIEIAILDIQSEKISKGETFSIDEILTELPNKIKGITLEKEGNNLNGSYKGYNFTINESMKLAIEGESMQIAISTEVKEYLGKNSNEKYAVKVDLTLNAKEKINKIKIENTDGSITTETVASNTYNKELELELDKEYKINIEAENGAKTAKTIQISSITNISNVEQLVAFRDSVNSGLTYEGTTVNLLNDIDLSSICYKVDGTAENDVSWEPIGNKSNNFKGTFNGNYKTIDNLYINSKENEKALFNRIENANINSLIIGKNSNIKTGIGAAGIVVIANNSVINNCGNNAKVEASNHTVGGIVANSQNNSISGCYNKGEIIAGNLKSGGIVGYNIETTISYCYNTASIKSRKMVGGIVGTGFDGTKIYNCYNTGKIEMLEGETSDMMGGISGNLRNSSIISYCYNAGEIITNIESTGGIAGVNSAYNGKEQIEKLASVIEYSYNRGNITATGIRVGGITGTNSEYSNVNNCYILDTVKVQKETVQAESDIGISPDYIGKLIGRNYGNYANIGTLTSSQMPTVYEVVNGLNSGSSQHWSNSNLEQPKLLWEK